MIDYFEWIRGTAEEGRKKREERTREWRWFFLVVIYTLLGSIVSYDIAYRRGMDKGLTASDAPKYELKLVPVKPAENEPNKDIVTGAEKFKDFEK